MYKNYKTYYFFILTLIFTVCHSLGVYLYVVNSTNINLYLQSINQDSNGDYKSFNCIKNSHNTPIGSPKISEKLFSNPELVGGVPVAITVAKIKANSVNVFTINPSCNVKKGNLFDDFTLTTENDPFTNIYAYRNLAVDYEHHLFTGFTADASVNYLFSYLSSEDISVVLNII